MSAPASMSAFAAPALFSAAAHIRAVCPFQPSFAFTLAPWASSTLTAGTLPVRAAVISAVSPSGNAVFASAPAASSFSIDRRVAVDARQIQRRHAVPGRRFGVGAGAKQSVDAFGVVALHRQVQRRRAVRLGLQAGVRALGLQLRAADCRRCRRDWPLEEPARTQRHEDAGAARTPTLRHRARRNPSRPLRPLR